MPSKSKQKMDGSYYTPDAVTTTLMQWAVHDANDRFLDPSCGDGRFLAIHKNSVGVEQDPDSARIARQRAPYAAIHNDDFFAWATHTKERFTAIGGNPPFIRYQTFKGDIRSGAIALCNRLGTRFNGLASSWAPFLVASASLLQPGGRLAFVVPAEIGHAPYATPALEYLADHFETVHVVAYREKLFPQLSEDCWLLYAEGYGGQTDTLRFTAITDFVPLDHPPADFAPVSVKEWKTTWNQRLRPFLLPPATLETYADVIHMSSTQRLGAIANVGIGYVSGDNVFFHLRPSEAEAWEIPETFLHPTVRRSEYLPTHCLTAKMVEDWKQADEPVLLLHIPKVEESELPPAVQRYLDTEAAHKTRMGYKCRTRVPWYSVPHVKTPDFFLTYMSGRMPSLVVNEARCTCANSIHGVHFHDKGDAPAVQSVWDSDFVRLSCELEGHPLGGGMLKIEPREAGKIVIPAPSTLATLPSGTIKDALHTMHQWRHYKDKTTLNIASR